MAEVNKISSFKSFSEIKSQENSMKLREENNLKRKQTLSKIEEILDEMGLTNLSEIDEDSQKAFISKLLGREMNEGNAFVYAASKAKAEGKDEFEFNGKKYKVTIKDTGVKEGNAFGDAVRKAKESGEKEFEFEGETYKVEEHLDEAISRSVFDRMDGLHNTKAMDSLLDSAKTIFDDLTEEMFDFDEMCDFIVMKIKKSKLAKMYESMVTEGAHGMATKLLKSIVNGESSKAEGIKMSKELAQHYIDWIRTSPFGKKNGNLPLNMLIDASFNWGIERGTDANLKSELKDLKATIKESVVTEGKEMYKISIDTEVEDSKIGNKFYNVRKGEKVELVDDDGDIATVKLKSGEIVNIESKYVVESIVNEGKGFKSTKDFIDFLEEIDGMPEHRIRRIMGKDYIDTPGGFRDEADDYDNDIEDYTLSNMGREDFEALKSWWENNVQESVVNEAEIKSDDEFKEYAFAVLKKAFGADFDEAKAGEVVDGILGKADGDYGTAVGMLTSSLGES